MRHYPCLVAIVVLEAISMTWAADGVVRLEEDFDTTWQPGRWQFSEGTEFPGASGGFERSKEAAHSGQFGGQLRFDFAGGGAYVAAYRELDGSQSLAAIRLWLKKPRGSRLTVRYTDPSDQTFQKGLWTPSERWVDVLIPMTDWQGHWGGANDGVVRGPPKRIGLLVENSDPIRGALLFDDLRLIPGEPGESTGTVTSEYTAARFAPEEGWRLTTGGNAAGSSLDGRTCRFDFSQGAGSIGVVPQEFSLLGNPKDIRIRARGAAPGHPVRMQIGTHFMTFEKTIGEFRGEDASEIIVQAPPGEGWRWFGGENDGKRHGPLRIRGVYLDAAGRADSGTLELLEIRVKTSCAADRGCLLTAECRERDQGRALVATVRSLLPESIDGTLSHVVRDWSGKEVAHGSTPITIPPGGVPLEATVPVPAGEHAFLEAEFVLEAPGQLVPEAQAYYTAAIEPQTSAEPDPSSPFGMGLYLYRYGNDPRSLASMDLAARMGREAGVKWSREEINWGRVEVEKGRYDWSFYDNMVATAKRHGISIYGLLAYWSRWTEPYTPEGIDDYCRFAAAAVDRYRNDIQHWEVYNEPNIFFWQGPRDMYAELLRKAYTAIKAANPDAQVLGCSTAGIDLDFIRRTMELGGPFDVLTIHPYRQRMDDREFVEQLRHTAEVAKGADGTIRPIWITEMGWATHARHNGAEAGFSVTTQREQAQLIARAYLDAIASGAVTNMSWYDFRNDGVDPFNFEHNMGIATRDFRPKPAYRAYATVARMLRGKSMDKELDLGDEVIAYRFVSAGGDESAVALWSTDDREAVKLPAEQPATIVNLMGEEERVVPVDGQVTVPLQLETPVFVLFRKSLDDWLAQLESDSAEARAQAVKALAEALQDEDPLVRVTAADALGDAGAEAAPAVPVLLVTIEDEEPYVRSAASEALGRIGSAAVPEMLKAFEGGHRSLRVRACVALGGVGPAAKDAVPALAKALQDPDAAIRMIAARSLGQIGSAARSAVPAIAQALQDEDRDVRDRAAVTLGELGPDAKEAIPALQAALEDEDEAVRTEAARAMERIRKAP